jgi:hypothetical protein
MAILRRAGQRTESVTGNDIPALPESWTRPHLAIALTILGLSGGLMYLTAALILPQLGPLGGERTTANLSAAFAWWSWVDSWQNPGRGVALVLALALAFVPPAAYLGALYLTWPRVQSSNNQSAVVHENQRLLPVIIGFALVFGATAVLAVPQADSDLYGYLTFARVAGVYGANPYTTAPIEFAPDPFLGYVPIGWAKSTTPYGPVWAYFSAGLARLTADSVAASVIGLRAALMACNVANALLIAALLRRVRPGWVLPGVILYAWNPIVALMGQSHNEPLMLLLVLLALYVELRGGAIVGGGLMALSIFTKFLTAPLMPLYAAYLWRTPRYRRPLILVAVVGLSVAVMFIVFSSDLSALTQLARVPGVGLGQRWPARVLLAGLMTVAATAWGAWHSRSRTTLWASAATVMLALLAFLPNSSYAWYLITGLGLAGLVVGHPLLTTLALALTVSYWVNNILVSQIGALVDISGELVAAVRWGFLLAALAVVAVGWWRGGTRRAYTPGAAG